MRTQEEILSLAVDLASADGLEGLTIRRLAERLNMSKSGLFAHFGSKEELQLAAIDAARDIFSATIVDTASLANRGLPRLLALLEAWLCYTEKNVFSGGCFFAAASAEFDGRPGAVRNRIAALMRTWLALLEEEARQARSLGQLDAAVDASQLVFELHAFVQEANWAWQLLGDKAAFARAREPIRRRLGDPAAGPVPLPTEARTGGTPTEKQPEVNEWSPAFD